MGSYVFLSEFVLAVRFYILLVLGLVYYHYDY